MEMPDSVNLTRMVTVSNGSSRIKIVEKEYKGGEPYHHSRIVEALRKENEELKAKLEKEKWQPIDVNPEEGQIVMVVWSNGDMELSKFLEGLFWFQSSKGRHLVYKLGMTHWMPLPDAPEQRLRS